jgi:hypothetical protein
MTALLILIVILLFIAVVVLVWLWRLSQHTLTLERTQARAKQKAAVEISRSGHLGLISQQLAPLLPGFKYSPKDVQWVGGTMDCIVWDGLEMSMEDGRDIDIVFIDVKTGRATISSRQRRIKDAIDAGRVRFEVFRPDTGVLQDAADVPVAEVPRIETVIIPPSTELDRIATLHERALSIEFPGDAS